MTLTNILLLTLLCLVALSSLPTASSAFVTATTPSTVELKSCLATCRGTLDQQLSQCSSSSDSAQSLCLTQSMVENGACEVRCEKSSKDGKTKANKNTKQQRKRNRAASKKTHSRPSRHTTARRNPRHHQAPRVLPTTLPHPSPRDSNQTACQELCAANEQSDEEYCQSLTGPLEKECMDEVVEGYTNCERSCVPPM